MLAKILILPGLLMALLGSLAIVSLFWNDFVEAAQALAKRKSYSTDITVLVVALVIIIVIIAISIPVFISANREAPIANKPILAMTGYDSELINSDKNRVAL